MEEDGDDDEVSFIVEPLNGKQRRTSHHSIKFYVQPHSKQSDKTYWQVSSYSILLWMYYVMLRCDLRRNFLSLVVIVSCNVSQS